MSQPRCKAEPKLVSAMSCSGSPLVYGMKRGVANDISDDNVEQKVPKVVLGVPDSEISVYTVTCSPTVK